MVRFEVDAWGDAAWLNCTPANLEKNVRVLHEQFTAFIHSSLKKSDVYMCLEAEIKDLVMLMPLLNSLKQSSMRDRHWSMLRDVLHARTLAYDSPTLQLKDLMRMGLLVYHAEVVEILGRAEKEHAMEKTLEAIEHVWKEVFLDAEQYKDTKVCMCICMCICIRMCMCIVYCVLCMCSECVLCIVYVCTYCAYLVCAYK
jgi:hypothetical protein